MLTVFKFEFLNAVKKKAFIISMAIMLVITALISFIPRIFGAISKGEEKPVGIYSEYAYINGDVLAQGFEKEFKTFESADALEAAVKSNDVDAGVLVQGEERKILMKSSSVTSMSKYAPLVKIAEDLERREILKDLGVSEAEAGNILKTEYYEPISLETDGAKNFWLVYIALFVLYMLIIMFSNQVAMSIAREKSDRTMELLITAAKPKELIVGKVAAYGLVGIISLIVVYMGVYIGTKLGGEYASGIVNNLNLTQMVRFDQILVTFLFFTLGYILYLFMMAAASSLVSKIEDVNTALQPLNMIFVISFFASYFGMMNPGIVLKVASFIPFSSPFAMIARYGVETVPMFEVLISLAILLVSTILIAKLSIKMYKLGSYNYGTKVNFFKSLFQAIKE